MMRLGTQALMGRKTTHIDKTIQQESGSDDMHVGAGDTSDLEECSVSL